MKKLTQRKELIKRLRSDPLAVLELYNGPEDRDVNESLVRALEDESRVVRRAAVESLVALNDLYAASSIYWTLRKGSDHARLAAAEVLGRLPEPFSIPYLVDALQDPVAAVRIASVRALGAIHDPRAIDSLKGILDRLDGEARSAALEVPK